MRSSRPRAGNLDGGRRPPLFFFLILFWTSVTAIFHVHLTTLAFASGSAPTIDAGPDKTIAFPAKDLTLFGHAADAENDPLAVRWTQVSGPGTAVFSAPWALATTATFSATGVYVFQLAADDGTSAPTSRVSVTVNPASSQTAFYVDPTFAGAGKGTAQAPWSSFAEGNPNQAAQWAAINAALAGKPVIVYFSARQAGVDLPEEIIGSVRVQRTDRSSNRLTLDGMSKYNTSDTSPSWTDYGGANKLRVKMNDACCFSLGWYDGYHSPDGKLDYVTLRGFEVTGPGARITWGGSYSVLEYIWSHDVTDLGATVQFAAAVSDYPACQDMGKSRDITVRNNLIERGIGEGLYIAGTYTLTGWGGCPAYGNTHSDILIEGNTIRDPGVNGDQGDGIDLKAGLMNVTVRNNVIQGTHPASDADGITSLGVFSPGKTNYLIEGNLIFNGTTYGMALGGQNSTVVRNNMIYAVADAGIYSAGEPQFPNRQMEIYNNTVCGSGAGVFSEDTHGITLRNNLLFGNKGSNIDGWSTTGLDSDYNLMAPAGSVFSEGVHSIVQADLSGIVANPASSDFRLISASPAVDKGANLSATGFANDFAKTLRPQGPGWDIGAYEYSSGEGDSLPPAHPKGLRVRYPSPESKSP